MATSSPCLRGPMEIAGKFGGKCGAKPRPLTSLLQENATEPSPTRAPGVTAITSRGMVRRSGLRRGRSGLCARPRGDGIVPSPQMTAVIGNGELDPAREVDRHEGGDVGNGVFIPDD